MSLDVSASLSHTATHTQTCKLHSSFNSKHLHRISLTFEDVEQSELADHGNTPWVIV